MIRLVGTFDRSYHLPPAFSAGFSETHPEQFMTVRLHDTQENRITVLVRLWSDF